MDSVSRFILLFPLILSISITPYQVIAKGTAAKGGAAKGGAAAPTDLLTKTCQVAVNQDLCVRTLKADPSSKQADVSGLAAITVKLALANATAISNHVKKLLASNPTPYDKARLTDCNELYESSVDQLKDTLASIQSKGLYDAINWLQAAMTNSGTCDDGFEEEPDHKSVLADKSAIFEQLCGNALAILNALAKSNAKSH